MVQAFEMGWFVCSLDYRKLNKGIGVDRVLRDANRSYVGELGVWRSGSQCNRAVRPRG